VGCGIRGHGGWTLDSVAAYVKHLTDAGDLFRAAKAAHGRAMLRHAEALYRVAALPGHGDVRDELALVLEAQLRDEEAKRVRLYGLNPDGSTAT
jgi:hypothetical protein